MLDEMRRTLAVGTLGFALGASAAHGAGTYASHPFLFRAKSDLTHAEYFLKKATHPCGGHLAAAAQKTAAALAEVDAALRYADAHPQEDPGPSR